MDKIRWIGLMVCTVWLVFSCTVDNGANFRRILDIAEQQNANFDSITNIDSIELAVQYSDANGSASERARAHYLLGCAYRDAGESPKALEAYHNALDCADTTETDFDYMLLVRIHSQMAELFYHQMLPYDQLKELEAMYHYALLVGNNRIAINAMEHKAGVYELLNIPDSIIAIRLKAYDEYMKSGYSREAAFAVGPAIPDIIDKGDLKKAKQLLDIYESEAIKNGEIDKRKVIYHYFKGKYCLATNNIDSAKHHFCKLVSSELPLNQNEAGYRGLYLLYNKIGQKDSLAKYADLCYQVNDSIYAITAKNDMQKMQSLYNYSRSQQETLIQKGKANRIKNYFYIVSFAFILISLVSVFTWIYLQRRKREEIRKVTERLVYEKAIEIKAKNDLIKIKEADLAQLEADKNAEQAETRERIEEYKRLLNIKKERVTKQELQNSFVYLRIQRILKDPKGKMLKKDWKDLEKMIDEKLPMFYPTLKERYWKLNDEDYNFCMLVRLYLSPSDIGILMGMPPSTVSMKRVRFLNSIFGIVGKAEDFDEMIQNIS